MDFGFSVGFFLKSPNFPSPRSPKIHFRVASFLDTCNSMRPGASARLAEENQRITPVPLAPILLHFRISRYVHTDKLLGIMRVNRSFCSALFQMSSLDWK
jgi:hypothetical protein